MVAMYPNLDGASMTSMSGHFAMLKVNWTILIKADVNIELDSLVEWLLLRFEVVVVRIDSLTRRQIGEIYIL